MKFFFLAIDRSLEASINDQPELAQFWLDRSILLSRLMFAGDATTAGAASHMCHVI